jgi:hypothetical protein
MHEQERTSAADDDLVDQVIAAEQALRREFVSDPDWQALHHSNPWAARQQRLQYEQRVRRILDTLLLRLCQPDGETS